MADILHAVFAAVAAFLAPVIVASLVAQLKRRGFELTEDQKRALDDEAQKAILYVEERSAAAATKWTSSQKLDAALAFVKRRLPKVTESAAHDAIHAALPDSPAGAYTVPGLERTPS